MRSTICNFYHQKHHLHPVHSLVFRRLLCDATAALVVHSFPLSLPTEAEALPLLRVIRLQSKDPPTVRVTASQSVGRTVGRTQQQQHLRLPCPSTGRNFNLLDRIPIDMSIFWQPTIVANNASLGIVLLTFALSYSEPFHNCRRFTNCVLSARAHVCLLYAILKMCLVQFRGQCVLS